MNVTTGVMETILYMKFTVDTQESYVHSSKWPELNCVYNTRTCLNIKQAERPPFCRLFLATGFLLAPCLRLSELHATK
jgi:hypothetical protein